ncbi:hypothetical protein EJB05_54863, partial [Eragrostis curvula]
MATTWSPLADDLGPLLLAAPTPRTSSALADDLGATNNLRKVSIADTTLAGLPEVRQSKYFNAADELAINHRQLCLWCGSRQPYEPEKEENENNA